MGALMRATDWSATVLGPVQQWPQSLRLAVSILLGSGYPMLICWGPSYIMLYNDAYRPILGQTKHPGALGRSCQQVFSEAWDFIGPLFDRVMTKGQDASTLTDQLFLLDRNNYLEECYFTFSYSPIRDDDSNVGGVFVTALETTERVLEDRRRRMLRDLAARTADARSEEEVYGAATKVLKENPLILPFSLLYSYRSQERKAYLVGSDKADASLAPAIVDCSGPDVWPLSEVLAKGEQVVDLEAGFAVLPATPWGEPPKHAVAMPISLRGANDPAAFLVAGLNTRRKFDDMYRQFVRAAADQIAAELAAARAYEQERKRAEALAELDRAKTLFFSNVSHEFRTPLTLMLGPLEDVLPEARERLSPERSEQLQVARRNALRLLKLVNTLLDFSRIEAGRVQAVYEPTDVCTFTADIASAFRSAMERAGLRFTVECDPISEPLYVDRDMWEKIVLNLLSNAFKFTFEGEVALTLRQAGDSVELAVRDTGVGIPADELSRVFERFHRIESARARTYEGTGIGLALVQELVRLHSGTVRVESVAGQGSTFTVSMLRGKAHLPADRIQAPRTLESTALSAETYVDEAERWLPSDMAGFSLPQLPSASAPDPAQAEGRDLVVLADDNADMREYLTRLLRDQYRVHAVGDGEQAVEAARKLRPALVLADVMMPRLDGFGVVHAIRSDPTLNGVPVVLLSARAGEESRVEGLQAGADDYLVKPFTARELLARVGTHIKVGDLRRQTAEREAQLRKQAELERHRLEELLAQAPAAIGLMSGPEHRWTYVNHHYIFVTGRKSAADFIGKTVRESLPEIENQPIFLELLNEVYRTGQPYFGREMLITLNRAATGRPSDAYFDFVYQPIRNSEGQVEGILVHAVEVTDKVTARKVIEASEERLRLAQTAAQIGTWEWDPVHDIRILSPELQQLFGTDPTEPDHAEKWAWRVHPEDRDKVYKLMMDGHRAGTMEFEYRYEHPRRGLRWYYCKGRRLESGTRMFGIVQDVTARKNADEARYRLAAIVESSDDAIVSKTLRGIVTSWNPCAERMFGYTAEEMIGRSIITIIPPELHHDEQRILDTIGRGERIEHFETVRVTKSGERIDVSLTISPVKDESGRIIGAAKIARDITQRKKAERALRITERLASVGRLAATVAHEINNPLEAVTNLVYLAKETAARSDVREYLAGAEQELERISHLTRQTLGFYRETKGARPMKLGSVVDPLISVFGPRARNKKIEIRPEIKGDPEINAVPGEIRQLLANLLGNSIDAVDGGGCIRVRVSAASEPNGQRRNGVRLTVADSGPGIPQSVRSQLFEPFFTTKKEVGTGLGLWVCKSIVERHHGSIRLKSSTRPGKSWTAFSVFLPASSQLSSQSQNPDDFLKLAV